MRQDLPTGPGSLYTRKEDGNFQWESMKTPTKASKESIKWLNYQQNLEPYSIGGKRIHYIRHAYNGDEIRVNFDGKYDNVDGYTEVDGRPHVFEFNGCRFHKCPFSQCKTKCVLTTDEIEKERLKFERLRKFSHLTVIYECQWRN